MDAHRWRNDAVPRGVSLDRVRCSSETVINIVFQQVDKIAGTLFHGWIERIVSENAAEVARMTGEAHIGGVPSDQKIVVTPGTGRINRHSILGIVHGVAHTAMADARRVVRRPVRPVHVVADFADIGHGVAAGKQEDNGCVDQDAFHRPPMLYCPAPSQHCRRGQLSIH